MTQRMQTGPARFVTALGLLLLSVVAFTPSSMAASRIKDIADFEGIRDNMLVGYGLVVGLNGTGDTLNNSPFTQQSLMGMLERLGVNIRDATLRTKNVAAVMVTARLPAFVRHGSRVDVTVSALGDATNLLGGTLLVTPLLGADGEVYAVAQGPVAVAGFSAAGSATTVTKGVPTGGRIASGAIVEREVGFELASMQSVKITLRNPDFTTARRVVAAINGHTGTASARPLDPTTVLVAVPAHYQGQTVDLLTDIEQLEVEPDQVARVIIDETTGIIVMGEKVRISTVAIAQGNLTIRITETPQVSQPNAFSSTGSTVVVPRTNVEIDQGDGKKLGVLKVGVTLQDLVNGLNAMGIGPRDMITILQAIKAAGALQAELGSM
ncbi:MAG: flagellar basal body P-ring protein FlgI [Alphaproteobacteria bacterium]